MSRRPAVLLVAVLSLVVALVSGCGSSTPDPNAADRVFLQDMIAHHGRAIEVGAIAAAQGDDPRVRAFGRRIVREQTPELDTLRSRAADTHPHVDIAAGARMATARITDAQVTALRAEHGNAFDRRFLTLSISSEQGAAAMSRTELAHGVDPASRKLAKAIASAPHTQIPELQALLKALS